MSGSRQITVSREYRHEPDYCTRAIELLLKSPISKKAIPADRPERRPERIKDDPAKTIIPE